LPSQENSKGCCGNSCIEAAATATAVATAAAATAVLHVANLILYRFAKIQQQKYEMLVAYGCCNCRFAASQPSQPL